MMYVNLKEHIEKKYNVKVEMHGKKQVCPCCGKKTFNLYGEKLDRGKCHHSNCGLHLNLNTINFGIDYTVVLYERFFEHSKNYLFSLDSSERERQAYLYATKERKISKSVLERSDVGAIDSLYDVEKSVEDLVEELNQKIEDETDEAKKTQLKGSLAKLTEQKEKLKAFIDNNYERLLFFYRDYKGIISQIKTRRPFEKGFQTYKIREHAGVFNADLFMEQEKKSKNKSNKLLVFEGEFNQLRFATLAMENAWPVQSCALGGAQGADLDTAMKITSGPVCIAYDNDEAGRSVLDRAKEIKSVYGVTTPEPHNDIDEYINSFKDEKKVFKAVQELLDSAQKYYREMSGIKAYVNSVMKYDKVATLDKYQKVAEVIIDELSERGKFLRDNNFCYIFLSDEKRVIPIIDNELIRVILNQMGVNAAKEYFRFVMEELYTHCYTKGTKIETHNFVHYDAKKFALYLFGGDKIVYKITPESIEELENGDEGVMFNYHANHEPFEFVEFDKNKDYFQTYILDFMNMESDESELSVDDQKELLRLWFFSTFFHSIMETKMILAAVGEKGSGKTSTLRRLGIILYGRNYNVTPLPYEDKDFDALVTNRHFVILDNVDSGRPWLNDKLASVSTGQAISARELYSNNKLLTFKTKTFLGATSRTPQFTREDVADRLICLMFKRIEQNSFIPESQLMNSVAEARNEIMSYIMTELQWIIKSLKNAKGEYKNGLRIADFGVFGLKINESKGRRKDFEELINRIITIQNEFATEEDCLVYALKILSKLSCGTKEYTCQELHKSLLDIADKERYDIPEFRKIYGSYRSLARRISNIKNNIKSNVIIKVRKGRSNTSWYTVELADKNFELPMTYLDRVDKAFDRAAEKALKEYDKTKKGGDKDE